MLNVKKMWWTNVGNVISNSLLVATSSILIFYFILTTVSSVIPEFLVQLELKTMDNKAVLIRFSIAIYFSMQLFFCSVIFGYAHRAYKRLKEIKWE